MLGVTLVCAYYLRKKGKHMVTSSSNTGNPGGIPEIHLLSDQSAAASVLRTSMGIIRNLDTISFTDVGKKALWKYESSPNKPTLHPLEHLRTDTSPSIIDDSWKKIMQDLINDLPHDVRVAYEQNLLLRPEEKNASLVALGRLLEGTAKALNWIHNSVIALDPNNSAARPGSEKETRRLINMNLANWVMSGVMLDSNAVFQSMRNELLKLGPNDPHFDDLVGILNQVGLAYSTILNLNAPVENTKKGQA